MMKPRFYFRLSEDDLATLKKRAKAAKHTPSEFARNALFRSDSIGDPQAERHADLVSRLIVNEESITELRTLLKETCARLEVVAMAAVASAAMLKDDGKMGEDAATRIIVEHIEDALNAAPGIVRGRQKLAMATEQR